MMYDRAGSWLVNRGRQKGRHEMTGVVGKRTSSVPCQENAIRMLRRVLER